MSYSLTNHLVLPRTPAGPEKVRTPAGTKARRGRAEKTSNYAQSITLVTTLATGLSLGCKAFLGAGWEKPHKGQLRTEEGSGVLPGSMVSEHMGPTTPLLSYRLSDFHAGLLVGTLPTRKSQVAEPGPRHSKSTSRELDLVR